ncbi:hypothetical protein [Parabacteroides sp.]
MQTNPNQPTETAITVEQFNKQVKDWTFQVRGRAKGRLRQATTGESSGKGLRTISPSFKSQYGEIYSTGFKFSFYLVFIHYGVGRGYIRKGGSVIRGHRGDNDKFRMYRGRPAKTWKEYAGDHRPVARHGFDWLDIEIRGNIERLADVAAAYHGDKAAAAVLKETNKLLIDKTP